MNRKTLKLKMVELDMSQEQLAALTGISRQTLIRKMNDTDKFTIGEVAKLVSALQITKEERNIIFFADEVS